MTLTISKPLHIARKHRTQIEDNTPGLCDQVYSQLFQGRLVFGMHTRPWSWPWQKPAGYQKREGPQCSGEEQVQSNFDQSC